MTSPTRQSRNGQFGQQYVLSRRGFSVSFNAHEITMPARKWCFVPNCMNTSAKTPQKIFVTVPIAPKRRAKWFAAARRDVKGVSPTSAIYCCEDHFDVSVLIIPLYCVNYLLIFISVSNSWKKIWKTIWNTKLAVSEPE